MKRKSPIHHRVRQHLRKRKIVRSYTRGKGFQTITISKRVAMKGFVVTRPDPTLLRLFRRQDYLIEHKFPTSNRAEYHISNAGDIYREMTNQYPHWDYVHEKIYHLGGDLRFGFAQDEWDRVKEYEAKPDYKIKRDQYMRNLQILEEETKKAKIPDPKRKQIMLNSLSLVRGLIKFYEGKSREATPWKEYIKLDYSVTAYFPKESKKQFRRVGYKKQKPKLTFPKPLMDVDPRTKNRLSRGGYIFEPYVPISEISLPQIWNKFRFEDNKKKLKSTKSMPPVFLHLNPLTQQYTVEDGIHRIHAAKSLGYTHVPAVIGVE